MVFVKELTVYMWCWKNIIDKRKALCLSSTQWVKEEQMPFKYAVGEGRTNSIAELHARDYF